MIVKSRSFVSRCIGLVLCGLAWGAASGATAATPECGTEEFPWDLDTSHYYLDSGGTYLESIELQTGMKFVHTYGRLMQATPLGMEI
jgi:hypothetical protein